MSSMKQRIAVFSTFVLLALSAGVSGYQFYSAGIFRDENNISGASPFSAGWGLILALALSLAFFFIMLFLLLSNKHRTGVWIGLAALLLVFSAVVNFQARQYLRGGEIPADNPLELLTLEELNALQGEDEITMIYFKRDDCGTCLSLEPELYEYLREKGISGFYYSTTADRDTRPEVMYEMLEKYQVVTVPSLVLYGKGGAERVFTEDILQELDHIYME